MIIVYQRSEVLNIRFKSLHFTFVMCDYCWAGKDGAMPFKSYQIIGISCTNGLFYVFHWGALLWNNDIASQIFSGVSLDMSYAFLAMSNLRFNLSHGKRVHEDVIWLYRFVIAIGLIALVLFKRIYKNVISPICDYDWVHCIGTFQSGRLELMFMRYALFQLLNRIGVER